MTRSPDSNNQEGVMIEVFLDEEYGYGYWVWKFPGTVEQLISDWQRGSIPLFMHDVNRDLVPWPSGDIRRATEGEISRARRGEYAAWGHVHCDDDTFLKVGDRKYRPFTGKN